MSGFRKAKAEQAALKIGIYGAAGSGKTLTSLLIGEGLAGITGKRVAFVDTEHGSDFYCKDIPERKVHPAGFDFDALYTKSLAETIAAVKNINTNEHGVVILDSMTHLWEAARLAYEGKQTRAGTIPLSAWGSIKKPYKELMAFLLSSPLHVIICGRQGNEFKDDEETGELKLVGYKMKAEGETAYEPHILLRMESVKDKRSSTSRTTAFAEKDRTSILAGKTFTLWPGDGATTFNLLVKPILPVLGDTQARVETEDEISMKDAEAMDAAERQKIRRSEELLTQFCARIDLAHDTQALKTIGKEITPDIKKQMMPADVTNLRARYQAAERRMNGSNKLEPVEA